MAWSSAHAKLHVLLRSRVLLPKNSRILVAVSGGQDSLCLAYLLIELAMKWRWSLAIVHCDHRWRDDSADNAVHVLALAEAWQVPAWLEVAQSPPVSEAAARKWRYECFARTARRHKYGYVVTGHTQSDRAETVLYNLIRGTGTDGIGTLPWARSLDAVHPPVTLVRPLLNFSRAETSAVCQQQQLAVWQDSTNQDLRFRRNRIRHTLLPYLRSHFNPQVESALSQMADIATAEALYLNQEAMSLYEQCVSQTAGATWKIQRSVLSRAPLALQRRVIKQLLQSAAIHPIDFSHVEKLVALLTAPNGSQTDPYPGGWRAQVQDAIILFTQKTP